jgi:hypothetical protein
VVLQARGTARPYKNKERCSGYSSICTHIICNFAPQGPLRQDKHTVRSTLHVLQNLSYMSLAKLVLRGVKMSHMHDRKPCIRFTVRPDNDSSTTLNKPPFNTFDHSKLTFLIPHSSFLIPYSSNPVGQEE